MSNMRPPKPDIGAGGGNDDMLSIDLSDMSMTERGDTADGN